MNQYRLLKYGELIEAGDEWRDALLSDRWVPVNTYSIGTRALTTLIGHYRRPVGTVNPAPRVKHALLSAGEMLQEGDEYMVGGDWKPVSKITWGMKVRPADSVALSEGYYRRPVPQDVATLREERDALLLWREFLRKELAGREEDCRAKDAEIAALRQKLDLARVPICVGKSIIGILAREGQWQSSGTGQLLIAASELHKQDPYAPAPQYRRLEAGEIIESGDEWRHTITDTDWHSATSSVGEGVSSLCGGLYRRPVPYSDPDYAVLPGMPCQVPSLEAAVKLLFEKQFGAELVIDD